MKFDRYYDPGHSWARVPRTLLTKLGIESQISSFSYMRNDHAYLEEDCDLVLFVNAMNDHGKIVEFRNKFSNKSSKIRSYAGYKTVMY